MARFPENSLIAKPVFRLWYHKLIKHSAHRNRFVGGLVNIKIFFCSSKLCVLNFVEDLQSRNGFFSYQACKWVKLEGELISPHIGDWCFLTAPFISPGFSPKVLGFRVSLRCMGAVEYLLGTHRKNSLPGKWQLCFRSVLHPLVTEPLVMPSLFLFERKTWSFWWYLMICSLRLPTSVQFTNYFHQHPTFSSRTSL